MLRSTTGSRHHKARSGFTLVELLVMAAVCVLIMAILASVFQTGIDAIRHVRAQGDMMDQLRSAGEVVKRDLTAEHFLPDPVAGRAGDRTKLSDYRFDLGDSAPRGGYFFISSSNAGPATVGAPGYFSEGTDSDGLTSSKATSHVLQFTSIMSGNVDANHFTASVPGGTATSPAAEIAYYLVPDPGQSTGGDAGYPPQPTFLLIRRQRLLAMNDSENTRLQPLATSDPYRADVFNMNGANVSKLSDVVTNNRLNVPTNTFVGRPRTNTNSRSGDDILLSNVLSFEVKAITNTPLTNNGGDTDFPYLTLPSSTFDTGSTPAPNVRIRSLQIRIRVYDTKMQMARQSTFIVDM